MFRTHAVSLLVCTVAIFAASCTNSTSSNCDLEPTYDATVEEIIEDTCLRCHSVEKEGEWRSQAPKGLNFDNEALIKRYADQIRQTVIIDQSMPPGAPLDTCRLEALGTYLDNLEQQECMRTCAGLACGDDGCGGTCGECGEGLDCQTLTGQCVEGCAPDCAAKSCGDDGCGGSCGTCTTGQTCDASNQCVCVPDCTGKVCGDDGCGGTCGACTTPKTCDASGQCVCVPDCSGVECGPDGCGGSCGTCSGSEVCNTTDGVCQSSCTPDCTGKTCGDDGCGGSCGTCSTGELCDASAQCVCAPDCTGKVCGGDGCGGSCGTCASGQSCDASAQCVCAPDCTGKVCGGDGCGGSCGTCASGESCSSGTCEPAPSFSGDIYPIFDAHCGGAQCHGGNSPSAGLDLASASVAYNSLVGVSSTQCNNRLLVDAGSPSTSYLLDKLEGTNLCSGSSMPKMGSLPQGQVDLVESWIAAGAMNN